MASGRMVDYLGKGLASARPASLSLTTGAVGLYFATDTEVLSAWDGATWTDISLGSVAANAVSITDAGGYFTATDVEGALQELGAGAGGAAPGSSYAQYLAASLEPDALEAVQKDAFSYVVGASETKLLMASWQTRIGATGRMEARNPQAYVPLRGVTVTGTGTGSGALVIDPTVATYADPWATYYDRRERIHELQTRVIPITGGGSAVPLLPGPYGAIITHVTCFNLAWTVWRAMGPNGPGFNLMDEESDTHPQRVGIGMSLPISKRTAGEFESSSASTTTGGAAEGALCMVLCPSDWSAIPDPLTYVFRDDFMGTSLDTGVWTRVQSTAGNVEINTTYQWCKLTGNSSWGTNGLRRTTGTSRTNGRYMMVDVFMPRGASATGVCIVGWSDGAGHAQSNYAHGINFAGGVSPGGIINIYENGTNRGTVGSGWTGGCIYRVRITMTTTGATYEIQGGREYPAIGSASWTTITPGTTSSATATMHAAASAWANTAYLSDMRIV